MTDLQGSPQEPDLEGGQASDLGSDVTEAARALIERREAEDREAAGGSRGPGRPRGVRDSRPRKRRSDSRRRGSGEAPEPEPAQEIAPPTEAELAGLGKAAENLWRVLACRFGGRRPLTPAEGRELAEAAHPVLAKYLGQAIDRYGAEFALAMTAWGLWEVTAPTPPPEAQPDA